MMTKKDKKNIVIALGMPSSYVETLSESELDEVIAEIPPDELKTLQTRIIINDKPKRVISPILKPKKIPKIEKVKLVIPKITKPKTAKEFELVVISPEVDFEDAIPKTTDPDIATFINRVNYMKVLDDFYKLKLPVLLVGEAGVGKSVMAEYFAYKKGLPFFTISADALLGIRELFGSLQIVGGTSYFIEGLFVAFCLVPSIILIDEVTALDPAKNFVFHQILAQRKFYSKEANKSYKLHDDAYIMFAGNPPSLKYTGLNKFNIAFADRMGAIIVEPLERKELNQIFEKQIPKDKLEKLFDYYDMVRKMITEQRLRAEFSLRSLRRIVGLIKYGYEFREAINYGFLNNIKPFEPVVYDAILKITVAHFG